VKRKFHSSAHCLFPANHSLDTHWGRVGESGQNALIPSDSLAGATDLSCKKFGNKTGLTWAQKHGAPKAKKYTVIEKEYDIPTTPAASATLCERVLGFSSSLFSKMTEQVPSKMGPRLQSLDSFIFSHKNMAATTSALNFNASKLPLGKLSPRTLSAGYLALQALSEVISMPFAELAPKYPGRTPVQVLEELTARYYMVIPHDFGRIRPPLVASEAALKYETELSHTLEEMRTANEIVKEPKAGNSGANELDSQFAGLGLQEATPLAHDCDEFRRLRHYFHQSHPGGTYQSVVVGDIFRIERRREAERFNTGGFGADAVKEKYNTTDARKLL
jgi:poly [ADP-ribose] polymerase